MCTESSSLQDLARSFQIRADNSNHLVATSFLNRAGGVQVLPARPCKFESATSLNRTLRLNYPRILIFDSDVKLLGLLQKILEASELEAITSISVSESSRLLKTNFFDVFVTINRRGIQKKISALISDGKAYCHATTSWPWEKAAYECHQFVAAYESKGSILTGTNQMNRPRDGEMNFQWLRE